MFRNVRHLSGVRIPDHMQVSLSPFVFEGGYPSFESTGNAWSSQYENRAI